MVKRVTARDVGKLANVSPTTVSFVLNNVPGMRISEETRTAVLEAARQLNYHPDATARRMVSGKTQIIGLVMRQSPEQAYADRLLPQILLGLSRSASAKGYHILFEPIAPTDRSDTYMKLIQERHVDGIVLSGPRYDDQELLKIHADGAHIVLLGQLPNSNIPFVDIDNIGGARLATQHLVGLGYRRIALITNASPAYTASADRVTGYQQALEAASIPFDQALISYGKFTVQSGINAMNELFINNSNLTAVFVASDTVALGALQAIRSQGLRVPEDIALVGFDDIPLAEYVDPPLTTIRLPAFGLGWGATEMLIRLIEQEEIQNQNVLLETELVVRRSCGAHLATQ